MTSDLKEIVEFVARDIVQSGTAIVFGVPGGGVGLDLIDKLSKLGTRFVTTHSEASAAIMAGTVGRLSGCAGTSFSIKGPGLANMLPGLAVCHFESLPLVALSESYSPSDLDRGHKWLDHSSLVKSVTKGCHYLGGSGQGYLKASELALHETPGPVLLNLIHSCQDKQEVGYTKNTNSDDRSEILRVIEVSQRPVVIAGSLGVREKWSLELNRLHCPVFTTASAKGLVEEHLPHAAGVFTGKGLQLAPESAIIPEADLVVGLGLEIGEVLSGIPFHCRAINITAKDDSVSRYQFHAIGSIEDCEEVFGALAEKKWGIEQCNWARNRLTTKLLQSDYLPANVFHSFSEYFGDRTRLVLDTGNFCTIGEHLWNCRKPDLFLCSGNGRYMGAGLPMAIGAALYDRSTPTIVICGDGGIGMYIAELKLAVQNHLPLLIMLFTDGGFASLRQRAVRDKLDQTSLKLKRSSWLETIVGLGISGVAARNLSQLENGMAEWNPQKGPFYIECVFDPEKYLNMTTDLR